MTELGNTGQGDRGYKDHLRVSGDVASWHRTIDLMAIEAAAVADQGVLSFLVGTGAEGASKVAMAYRYAEKPELQATLAALAITTLAETGQPVVAFRPLAEPRASQLDLGELQTPEFVGHLYNEAGQQSRREAWNISMRMIDPVARQLVLKRGFTVRYGEEQMHIDHAYVAGWEAREQADFDGVIHEIMERTAQGVADVLDLGYAWESYNLRRDGYFYGDTSPRAHEVARAYVAALTQDERYTYALDIAIRSGLPREEIRIYRENAIRYESHNMRRVGMRLAQKIADLKFAFEFLSERRLQ